MEANGLKVVDPLSWRRVLEENEHCLIGIRHGETTFNVEGRCATTTDVPLTDVGRIAALESARSLSGAPVDRVLCSPMQRARETAELMLPGREVEIDDRLREPPAGPFEGEVLKDLWEEGHELSSQFTSYMDEKNPVVPDGAESIEETEAKAAALLSDLGEQPGRVVAFSHGGLLRILASMFAGSEARYAHRLKVDNCHAIALKWYPRPPHQVLAVNLPPSASRGRFRDKS